MELQPVLCGFPRPEDICTAGDMNFMLSVESPVYQHGVSALKDLMPK